MNKIELFWIPVIVKKISVLLFILATVVFSTFIIGNFQEFLDSTQLLLINIFEFIAILFIIVGVYHMFFLLYRIVRLKSKEYVNLAIILVGEILVIFIYILIKIIDVFTKSVI